MTRTSRQGPSEREDSAGHIDRLVGRTDEAAGKELAALVKAGSETPRLDMGGERIELREVEKTERDRAIIRLTAEAADGLMRRYGREKPVEIPDENLHLIEAAGDVGGFYDARKQQLAVVRKPGQDTGLAADLFHELVHAKSYNALKTDVDGGGDITYYRTGLETVTRDGKTLFRELNEAVVQTMTMRFYDETIARDPMFSDEIRLAQYRGDDPREREEGSYWAAKEHFRALTGAIAAAGRDRAAADAPVRSGVADEVRETFFRAAVTGNLLEIARLVEDTWGAGSFRKLGQSLDDFCREHIYKRRPESGLVEGLIERVKKPIRSVRAKCSSLTSDDSSLIGGLFRSLKSRLGD